MMSLLTGHAFGPDEGAEGAVVLREAEDQERVRVDVGVQSVEFSTPNKKTGLQNMATVYLISRFKT